jgi:PAS domain S-box-containing protein
VKDNNAADDAALFEAFVKSAQYFVRLKTQQDIWEHLAKFVTMYFPAAWSAFVRRDSAGELALHHCTPPDVAVAERILTGEVRSAVADVLESGFLASRVINIPAPSMTVFLPIVVEYQTKEVMLIGHKTTEDLSKDAANVYLALAGLAGTASERLHNEQELNKHRASLERLVAERTAELANAKGQNELILTSAREGICGVDLKGNITFINPFGAQMLGWDPAALLGQNAHATFHHSRSDGTPLPEDKCLIQRALTKAGAKNAEEGEFARQEGTRFPVELMTAPIIQGGQVIGAVLTFQDVTERRRAEAALREREEQLGLFVEHAPAAIAMFDAQVRYVFASRRWLADYGLTGQELKGRSHYEIFPEIPERWREIHRRCLAGATESAEEDRFERADGTVQWLRWAVHPWRTAAGSIGGIIIFSDDITQRKQAEEVLRKAKAEAEHANKVKDEFLAVLSHELRTPLTSMLGWVKILQSQKIDPAGVHKGLAVIERNVKAQTHLIEDLLDVSRIIAGKMTIVKAPLDLAAITRDTAETFRPAAQSKGIDLRIKCASAPAIGGDEPRIQQVVSNLVSNALKFTPNGGRVEVAVTREVDCALLCVSDSGRGISREFLPRMFDRFTQEDSSTSRSFTGLGLGLAIVRHIVELHGGSISAHSDGEGQGATFKVKLPLLAEQPRTLAGSFETTALNSMPLRGVKILAVDDDNDIRELLAECLRLAGAEVGSASSLPDALQSIEKFRPAALVCDIGLPGDDGNVLMREVRVLEKTRGWKAVVAVALTGYAQPEDAERCRAAGYQAHLAKPIEPDVLIKTVLGLLGQS